jgi:pimeloyl-ACP methyl ester carboxylesterase
MPSLRRLRTAAAGLLLVVQPVPGGRHLITQSGHDIQQEQPELVLDAIRDVVRAVRSGELVPQ